MRSLARSRQQSKRTWRSDSYLSYVRSRPCVVTGSETVIAHHVRCLGGGGMGLKPPDWMCLPLDPIEHAKLHSMGERSYWASKGLDPVRLVSLAMLVFLAREPHDLDTLHSLGQLVET